MTKTDVTSHHLNSQGLCILRNVEFRKRVICRIISAEKHAELHILCKTKFCTKCLNNISKCYQNVTTAAAAPTINTLLKLKTVDDACLRDDARRRRRCGVACHNDDATTSTTTFVLWHHRQSQLSHRRHCRCQHCRRCIDAVVTMSTTIGLTTYRTTHTALLVDANGG